MYELTKEDEKYKWKKEAIAVTVALVLCVFSLILSLLWIINPRYDFPKEKDIIRVEQEVIEIEESPIIIYSNDVIWRIALENGKNILLTENLLEYINVKMIESIQKGKTVEYLVNKDMADNDNFEAVQLSYEGEEIYNINDYYTGLLNDRKSAWLVAPVSLFGIIFFSIDLCRCINYLKVFK